MQVRINPFGGVITRKEDVGAAVRRAQKAILNPTAWGACQQTLHVYATNLGHKPRTLASGAREGHLYLKPESIDATRLCHKP